MRQFKIKAPIYVELGKKKKKKYFLNLNLLRNQVGHLNNNIKIAYKTLLEPLLPIGEMYFEYYSLDYELFLPDSRRRDISNLCSIIDKNFGDSIVSLGIVPEDNYYHLQDVHYRLGGYDEKGKGYVIITVKEIKHEDMLQMGRE